MPRIQRKKSKTGYYHIIIRGNEKQNIFNNDEDRFRFIETLYEKKQESLFYLHAFCLMDNHVHLMMREGIEEIAKSMKRITVSYVYFFNNKYKRVGHLLQDRFRSEVVENESYLLSLARYIHQNPVKAGMVKSAGDFKWSSYNAYRNEKGSFQNLVDTEVLLGMFSNHVPKAQKLFAEFMNLEPMESHLDISEEYAMDEDKAKKLFQDMLKHRKIKTKDIIPNDLIIDFQAATGLSIRKIAKIVGFNKDKVNRILKGE